MTIGNGSARYQVVFVDWPGNDDVKLAVLKDVADEQKVPNRTKVKISGIPKGIQDTCGLPSDATATLMSEAKDYQPFFKFKRVQVPVGLFVGDGVVIDQIVDAG